MTLQQLRQMCIRDRVKETMPLLRECTDINFVGSIEARDIPKGDADVIVLSLIHI